MYLNRRFYIVLMLIVLLLGSGYVYAPLFAIAKFLLLVFVILTLVEAYLLFKKGKVYANRKCAERFSNGDENEVKLNIKNEYPFTVNIEVIDEIPFVFQRRDICFSTLLMPDESQTINYSLRPTSRGVYSFGQVRVFVMSRIGFLSRRFSFEKAKDVTVYPSFLMLHSYELLAMSDNLTELGIKRIRRVGVHTEFEQIKEYVKGDDYRTINWKASARIHQLMVNVYQDERSQQVYSVIDKGRVMQQAFGGMTLLDYAINASLVVSYVAMKKEDKAGLVTFAENFETFIPASKHSGQLQTLLNNLFGQHTTFGETDYSALCIHLGKQLNRRSLLILYTNFSSMSSLNRQLIYLKQLNRQHRLLVVFFEDSELKEYVESKPKDTEGYYRQVIAEKFIYEKQLIASTLKQNGIYSLLTTPENLSIDVINKYLEMKSRQLL